MKQCGVSCNVTNLIVSFPSCWYLNTQHLLKDGFISSTVFLFCSFHALSIWSVILNLKNVNKMWNKNDLTFPISVFPSASLIKTPLFSPSSYGQYEPPGWMLLIPGSCKLKSKSHAHTHRLKQTHKKINSSINWVPGSWRSAGHERGGP